MNIPLNPSQISVFAEELDAAACKALEIPQLTARHRFNVDDAYRIQQATVQRRVGRGEQIIGVKMGFTSRAKMAQMSVSDQILGQLTSGMRVNNGASISFDTFIHPRCEPEVGFLLRKDLGANATVEEAFDALGGVAPAIDIIDSRYKQFQFSLSDVIADNASSAAFILGEWVAPPHDIAALVAEMAIDGEVRQRGSTGDILGNPLLALVSAARLASAQGFPLKEGSIVLAGAVTSSEPFTPGMRVQASIANLGEVHFSLLPTR